MRGVFSSCGPFLRSPQNRAEEGGSFAFGMFACFLASSRVVYHLGCRAFKAWKNRLKEKELYNCSRKKNKKKEQARGCEARAWTPTSLAARNPKPLTAYSCSAEFGSLIDGKWAFWVSGCVMIPYHLPTYWAPEASL